MLAIGIWLLVDDSILKLVNFLAEGESNLFRAAAILLIALGGFVVLVSALGFVGACFEKTSVLTLVSSANIANLIFKQESLDNVKVSAR